MRNNLFLKRYPGQFANQFRSEEDGAPEKLFELPIKNLVFAKIFDNQEVQFFYEQYAITFHETFFI